MQLRIVPNFPFRSPLHGYRADLTSQGGEDGLAIEANVRSSPSCRDE
jgi:hypothetical protein